MRENEQVVPTTARESSVTILHEIDLGAHHLSIMNDQSIDLLAAAMGQLLQFLKTKVANAGGDLFIASRWFPSRHPLFVLRAYQETHAPQASDLSVLGLWTLDRPRSQRRFEPGLVRHRNASPASRVKLAVLGSGYDRT